jgi:hypothetical protein
LRLRSFRGGSEPVNTPESATPHRVIGYRFVPMLHDAETWRSASALIATYGPDAAAVAAGKANRADADKAARDARRWRRVAAAITDLQRARLPRGRKRN